MFGAMQSLNISRFPNPETASANGYSKDDKYAGARAVEILEAVIVGNGTVGGNPTVDLLIHDSSGNKYVCMITGRLLAGLVGAIED